MHRTTITIVAAAMLAVAAGACGGDDGASTYQATREGDTAPPRDTRPRDTRPPRTDPSTPGTIVLPTFPSTSSTNEPPSSIPAASDITVGDTWFLDDGFGGVSWGATFESTAAGPLEYVPVQAEFFDADGAKIGTTETTLALVLPGPAATAEYAYDLDGTPASIEVTIGDGDVSEFDASGALTVSGGASDATTGAYTGQITSTYATDLDDVTTVAVWRDAGGAVSAIAGDYVRLVQANGVTWFSIAVPSGTAGDPAEVYVTPRPAPYALTPPDAGLAVQESWFRADGSGGYDWGTIVTNSGTTTWSGPYVLAKFYDADNRLIDSDDGYFGTVAPGPSAVVGYIWDAAAEPTRVEVAFVDGGYDTEPETGELTVGELTLTPDAGGTSTLTGTVTSTFAKEQSFAQVIFVWRDASNAVAFATSSYVDTIPAGGSAPIEVTLYGENLPTTPPTETYWSV
jgi:hypothetical protein